ncbi:hypothetical protein LOK49_LG01G02932 [Camellia lanceoleosa]|uniref:Uncharacterized protein n=1 Tax=Camellia lanceoleosa TaxID=1840588 RepID=A0ACC0IYN1_9ERIC|nr:hypothetical protein LOK49_LG01G02932 [Camellia lanceoleosa]
MADSHHPGAPPRVSGLEEVDHVELLEELGESDDVFDPCLIGKVITQKTLNKQVEEGAFRSPVVSHGSSTRGATTRGWKIGVRT